MNKALTDLIRRINSGDSQIDIFNALTDLGLLLELRSKGESENIHIVNSMFVNQEFVNLKISKDDAQSIISFLFYFIMCNRVYSERVAWCLGKSVGFDILLGLQNLLNIFQKDDFVTLQLLYGIDSLFGLEKVRNTIHEEIDKILLNDDRPESKRFILEHFEMLKA